MSQKARDTRPARGLYNLEKRWEKNKKRKIAKQARIEAKQKAKKEGRNERIKSRDLQDQGDKGTS